MKTRKRRPVLGGFGKAVEGAVSLNFGSSSGVNCDRSACGHHKRSTIPGASRQCYATSTQAQIDRRQLQAKLSRHSHTNPATLVNRALVEMQSKDSIPWLRISSFGSVPMPSVARQNRLFLTALRGLFRWTTDLGIPTHFPVEGFAKARFYRALVGDLVTVRESCASARRFVRASGAVSVVAGSPGTKLRERIAAARELARRRRKATGRKTVICPAIANTFASKHKPSRANPRAKCGNCTACAAVLVDVVYPFHK